MARGKHSIYLQVILLWAAIFLNPISCSHGESKLQEERKLLFVFGDSLFDPGNNQYLSSENKNSAETKWPYGMSFHNHSTGRLSDGLLVPDFIALFAGLHILPPYMEPNASFSDGVNFASGGAGVLEKNNSKQTAMNLRTQLDDFKKVVASMREKMGEANAKKVLMRSVFLISLGGNDYTQFSSNYPNATEIDRRNYVHMVIGNLTNGFKELYGMGLRKLAVQNVGPMGCYPMMKAMSPQLNGSCDTNLLKHATQHNKALSVGLKKLQQKLPGFKYSIMDYYHALGDRMKNPTKYGFKVGDTACCGTGLYNARGCGGGGPGSNGTSSPYNLCKNPNEYVLFDGGHHTQRTNHQLAHLLWSGVPNATAPCNVKQLFDFA